MAENEGPVNIEDLPITFQVKYLGQSDARGLWGIKHTRKPVDLMVAAAKALPPGQILPIVKLVISVDGVQLETVHQTSKRDEFEHMSVFFNIESISYGVQDLVYTRVFSMIIVKDKADVKGLNPFECHAFVCESRNAARRLTYSLAAAFQDYSRRVKELQTTPELDDRPPSLKKRFAIDLRTPEEIEADLETEA
ncbi:uncharacterized protein LOC126378525 [Pectinophora gossypiella]|uniref:PID domain-containing protein n=1 Tax=Pectinophora gossypiella TaxID=13191 RepID=A0A1E1WPJ2_PECGO|nr:uncharacterized protein LOC126378525 [Pectinophora gossypiella]XP_049882904.1 uncharacterized protein LOC126378525 [Pectinophora gossypiella]XP_049882905.1 uncharacterized protein LOC126378525 [Pectinophora gossypiella]